MHTIHVAPELEQKTRPGGSAKEDGEGRMLFEFCDVFGKTAA